MLANENIKKLEVLRGNAMMEMGNSFIRMRINDQKLEF